MTIHKLPDYLINRIKAGEIVERPASVLKELVENALDAHATHIIITINNGGTSLISVQDDGSGIAADDADLVLERYATSKISNEDDLYTLSSYGFRGEALASIAEVSRVTIQTKTADERIGRQIRRAAEHYQVSTTALPFDHGTIVTVSDLFFQTPARLKFLKSTQTEYFYCYQLFIDFALLHPQIRWTLRKNDTMTLDLSPTEDIRSRIALIYKHDRNQHLITVNYQHDVIQISGVISNAGLRFTSADYIKIYVNSRPITDSAIKKAILTAYHRQLAPGESPLAILMIQIKPSLVDVNVHPRKIQVKFVDGQFVFGQMVTAISQALGQLEGKISTASLAGEESSTSRSFYPSYGNFTRSAAPRRDTTNPPRDEKSDNLPQLSSLFNDFDSATTASDLGEYQVMGQLWQTYIVLSSSDGMYLIDQHALAERIAYEKLKKHQSDRSSQPLLQALRVSVPRHVPIEDRIQQLGELGFDLALRGEGVVMVTGIPRVFEQYPVDLEKLFDAVWAMESISMDHIIDRIYAMSACRASIKAGDRLSTLQVDSLIRDGFEHIDGMFVCQHGRSFFVKIEKTQIEKMMGRA